jgi:hypothetical protein
VGGSIVKVDFCQREQKARQLGAGHDSKGLFGWCYTCALLIFAHNWLAKILVANSLAPYLPKNWQKLWRECEVGRQLFVGNQNCGYKPNKNQNLIDGWAHLNTNQTGPKFTKPLKYPHPTKPKPSIALPPGPLPPILAALPSLLTLAAQPDAAPPPHGDPPCTTPSLPLVLWPTKAPARRRRSLASPPPPLPPPRRRGRPSAVLDICLPGMSTNWPPQISIPHCIF